MAVTKAENVIKLAAQADAVTGNLVIHKIRWVGATTAAHLVNITNTAGGNIFADSATGSGYSSDVDFCPPLTVKGAIVNDLDSGTVYLYT